MPHIEKLDETVDLRCFSEIIGILQEVKQFLQQPGMDVSWSRYSCAEEAVEDIGQHVECLQNDDQSKIKDLCLLFAPTGSLQEISLANCWGGQFLSLAARFDRAIESIKPK